MLKKEKHSKLSQENKTLNLRAGDHNRAILKTLRLKKSYRNEKVITEVLKGIDIEIREGEFVCIMGKSGSGKSTFLNLLSSLDRPDEGEILFLDRDLSKLSDDECAKLRRESFGFVFQSPKMVKNLTILDNIMLAAQAKRSEREKVQSRALQLLKEVGIEETANKKITQVSGGQLQRAGICRALINDPAIIFADEPTGALDSKSGEDVLEVFEAFHRGGKTIVMVTHDIHVAARAQRVLFMKDGLLAQDLILKEDKKENLKLLQSL